MKRNKPAKRVRKAASEAPSPVSEPLPEPLPDPLWCFLDGPLAGGARRIMGKEVLQKASSDGINFTAMRYVIVRTFAQSRGELVILGRLIPKDARRWAKMATRYDD